jgi:hypothetical protein
MSAATVAARKMNRQDNARRGRGDRAGGSSGWVGKAFGARIDVPCGYPTAVTFGPWLNL